MERVSKLFQNKPYFSDTRAFPGIWNKVDQKSIKPYDITSV